MPKRPARPAVGDLFAPGGPLGSAKPGYRERPQQVDLPQAVPFEAGRVVGPPVEVDQQPHAARRERGQGPLRARIGAPEHAGRDPLSPIGQAQEHAEGDPRLRQAD